MILEFNVTVAKAWFIVLFVCFVLACNAWLGITCNKKNLESENPFSFKFEIGQVVYIFKDNRIYKDKIKEIKVNEQGKKYTGIKLKDIKENNIYATFDDLCNDNKLNKDDIMMYAYNNDIDKRK